jgi:translin
MSLHNLDAIAERIRQDFTATNAARDRALTASRELVRLCSLSIRAVHRAEFAETEKLLVQAETLVSELTDLLKGLPDIYQAGYVQDALKEFAEAKSVYALVSGRPLPDPDEIRVGYAPYLNGLCEAVGELRRYILDALRQGRTDRCEEILQHMDDIYSVMVTMDFPDAITGNLRRTTDVTRGIMEKTRGDLTTALRQDNLEKALAAFEARIGAADAR